MTAKARPQVFSSRGPVALGRQLGHGGEAVVYEVVDRPDAAAKIYHKPILPEKSAKIEAMAAMRQITNDQISQLLSLTAWPMDLLRTPQRVPCGLVMPKVSDHKDIHMLYSPRSRKVEFPAADWRFLVRAAVNVARAFAVVHEAGSIIGDVNHGGITVSAKATVKLIDCDSFQVTARGQRFLCDVATPTFTPPELQGRSSFRGVVRTPNHDNFGLAIMVFHLLFMGRHPFAGRFHGRGEMSLEKAIEEFRFAYGANRSSLQMEPPPNMPPLAAASHPVALLFERAFVRDGARDGGRPTAREWIAALESLEKQLKRCEANASHHYLNSLLTCPWCHVEAATGVVLFNITVQTTAAGTTFNIDVVWRNITAVQSPGPLPTVCAPNSGNVAATPEAVAAAKSGAAGRIFGMLFMIAILVAVAVVFPPAAIFCLIAGGFLLKQRGTKTTNKDALAKYRAELNAAQARQDTVKVRWERDASDARFREKLGQLERLRTQYREIPATRQRRYAQLEQERQAQQMRRHLERFEIERAPIKGIGPGRKAMLASYNIETAWDIAERQVMKVPGFGPAMTQKLLKWRRDVEARFRFDPSKGVDPNDIVALDRELADTQRKLGQGLATGAAELVQIRNQIIAQRNALQPQMEQVQADALQAQANLTAVIRS